MYGIGASLILRGPYLGDKSFVSGLIQFSIGLLLAGGGAWLFFHMLIPDTRSLKNNTVLASLTRFLENSWLAWHPPPGLQRR